jgi:hypothetical protein
VNVDDITESTYRENVCNTALQCLLASIDIGVRSGGGMGEALDKDSWKFSSTRDQYIARFFYNIFFFIFIIMIMGNYY